MGILKPPIIPQETAARIEWFIKLRWLAAIGVLVFIAIGRLLLKLQFVLTPFVLIAIVIGLYNACFLLLVRRIRPVGKGGDRFVSIQVAIDILVLTILMHYGGGIENPFISYYLFHIIIAAILLTWRQVVLQVLLASVCITGLAIAEFTGRLTHHHVEGFLSMEIYSNWKFVTVAVFSIITTLFVSAFLATSITQRLHEREKQLSQANVVLSEQDRIKSRYVLRVAHDLAEPAGMITSCLKIVTQGFTGDIPEKALDMIQRAQDKSEYLAKLVKDLLSLSRIKAARKIPKSAVQLQEIAQQVFEEIEPHVVEKNLTLKQNLSATLPAVYGNKDAIYELLSNLLTNAVKYTPVGGQIEIRASKRDDDVLVEIKDDGIGIPTNALSHIFEEFYRADNVKTQAVEGTGLGLSIVKQILDAHGGKIWIKTKQDQGTTFSFTLLVAENQHA